MTSCGIARQAKAGSADLEVDIYPGTIIWHAYKNCVLNSNCCAVSSYLVPGSVAQIRGGIHLVNQHGSWAS